MPLRHSSRADLTHKFVEIGLAETTINELLSCLPASDYEAPITRPQLESRLQTDAVANADYIAEVEDRLSKRLDAVDEGIKKIRDERFQERLAARLGPK